MKQAKKKEESVKLISLFYFVPAAFLALSYALLGNGAEATSDPLVLAGQILLFVICGVGILRQNLSSRLCHC